MLALLDGDVAAYRSAAATQHCYAWEEGEEPSIWANPEEAIKGACETIRLWADMAKAKEVIVALTGATKFRKAVFPTYNARRTGERPVALARVKEALAESFRTVLVEGLEADDLLGMAATMPRHAGKAVVVSVDKDMHTFPGLHLNPLKDKVSIAITEAEANKNWFYQTLVGDATDGYPGCPKIGPKKAERLLEPWDGADPDGFFMDVLVPVFTASLAAKGDPSCPLAYAVCQARMARILRHGDYAKDTRTVKLWHPTTPGALVLPKVKS